MSSNKTPPQRWHVFAFSPFQEKEKPRGHKSYTEGLMVHFPYGALSLSAASGANLTRTSKDLLAALFASPKKKKRKNKK